MVAARTELTTGPDVGAYLAAAHGPVDAVRDGRCAFAISIPPTPTQPGMRIDLVATRLDDLDGRWLALTSVIGSVHLLSTAEMLVENERASIGALCTHDGQLAVRQVLPLDRLVTSDLDETIRALAHVTLFLRTRLRDLGG